MEMLKKQTVLLKKNAQNNIKPKLEIWGKAQRESARRPKSDWGKLEGAPQNFGPAL